jgi:hypothetical protein
MNLTECCQEPYSCAMTSAKDRADRLGTANYLPRINA